MTIIRHFLGRVAGSLPVIFLVSVVAFSIVHLVPGDPARQVVGEDASPEMLQAARERLGVDEPILRQYIDWAGNALRGDLGESLFTPTSVSSSLIDAGQRSLSLAAVALIIAVVLGATTGIVAALREGRPLDRLVGLGQAALIAMPNFWLGIVLVSAFALNRGWFPPTGYAPLSEGVWPWLSHLILPALALASTSASVISRHTRATVVAILREDYVRTALSGGASTGAVVRKYVLRNASITVLTVIGLQVGFLLGGAVVVEAVFAFEGVGVLATQAVVNHDYPMVQGVVVVVGICVVFVNLLIDVCYALLDPRVGDGRR